MEISSLYQSHGQLKSPRHRSLITLTTLTTKHQMPSHQQDHQPQHQHDQRLHPQRLLPQQLLKKKRPQLEPPQHQTIPLQHLSMQRKITNCHPMKMWFLIQWQSAQSPGHKNLWSLSHFTEQTLMVSWAILHQNANSNISTTVSPQFLTEPWPQDVRRFHWWWISEES